MSRDDEHLNSYPPEKGTLPRTENDISEAHDAIQPPQQPKKKNGFFKSFLCCLGCHKRKPQNPQQYSSREVVYETEPRTSAYLLPPVKHKDMRKKCMVIDLDETLVHSSFKPIKNADFIVPVEIDGTVHQVYVLKRPHVDEFLKRMGELYECVLFTASLPKYADPVADLLDKWDVFRARLFRESCVFHRGNYVKDLNKLGRELQQIIIIDNSPASYIFHPDNAVPVASWFDDMSDTELLDLIPFFEKLCKMDNVYTVLCNSNHPYNSTVPQLSGPSTPSSPGSPTST